MKGPQKACCREYLKRKLDSLLNQGKNLGAELVAARLQGASRRFSLSVPDERVEEVFETIVKSVEAHLEQYGTVSGTRRKKKKKFEIVVLLRKP